LRCARARAASSPSLRFCISTFEPRGALLRVILHLSKGTTCAIIRYDRARAAPPTAPLQRVEYSAAAGSYTAPPVARARAPTDCGVWPGRPGTQSLEAHAGTQRPHRSRYRQPRSCDSQEFLSSKSRVSCPPRPASLAVPLLQWCARARAPRAPATPST
jgi:hypothetical protein